MAKGLKIFKISIIVLIALVIVLLCTGFVLIRNPWTPVKGRLKIPGLTSEVKVLRDEFGIPDIFAENLPDMLFAQGFVHAQDRLFQMDMMRHLCRGTMSSIVGATTIDLDKYFRTMGLGRIAADVYAAADAESKKCLQDYTQGVNAYITRYKNRLPIEYTILGYSPQPWEPADCIVISGLLSLHMHLNMWQEVIRTRLIAVCGIEATEQLMTDPPGSLDPDLAVQAAGAADGREISLLSGLQNIFDANWGSNNWVIHGKKTDTGKPFLANDVHLGLSMPSVWYEIGLHRHSFNANGFSIPGIPLIIIGHNDNIFWGVTNLDPDVQDLYVEQVDDEKNPTQYLYKGEYLPVTRITEIIEVKNAKPVAHEILFTHHGPLINKAFGIEAWQTMTLKWAAYDSRTIVKALISLNRARNWAEFKTALSYWDGLHQNFVYADTEGNIGYQAAGIVPVRTKEHSGLMPVKGWTGEYEWQGYIPYEKLPYMFNPSRGFIATANSQVENAENPLNLTVNYFPEFRKERIHRLLSAKEKYTLEDMQKIQGDTYSLAAEMILPYLLQTIPENEKQKQALAYLREWDLLLDLDSTAASIYETWYYYLLKNTVSDELKDTAAYYVNDISIQRHVLAMSAFLKDPDNQWFDDIRTAKTENRQDILNTSLNAALAKLESLMGKNMHSWRWSRIHRAVLADQPVGAILGFFNKILPMDGGESTINQGLYQRTEPPFMVIHGTSQRLIMDVSDPNQSLAINTTGQNGNLFHPHRTDQTELFMARKYQTMFSSRKQIEEHAVSALILY